MTIARRHLTPLLSLLAGLALACGGPARDGAMVSVEPPGDWEEQLAFARSERDRFFRDSPDSPLPELRRGEFEGLEYWEPREGWYFVGDLHRFARPEAFEIPTTAGASRPAERFGWIRFRADGQTLTLNVYRLLDMAPGPEAFLLPFRDETSGDETYPAGRYLSLDGPAGGPYVIDFNRAYNPSCAYGDVERFACPVTPPENRLPIRIDAGERGYRKEDAG